MGTQGMRYSLVSRDVIADSIETTVAAEGFDGLVAIGGCDKNMPGCMIAIARLNRPAVFVYGGTIRLACPKDRQDECNPMDIVSVFEAVGQHAKGELTDAELKEVEQYAIPGRFLRGHVYRQHHGQCDRGTRHEPAQNAQRRSASPSATVKWPAPRCLRCWKKTSSRATS